MDRKPLLVKKTISSLTIIINGRSETIELIDGKLKREDKMDFLKMQDSRHSVDGKLLPPSSLNIKRQEEPSSPQESLFPNLPTIFGIIDHETNLIQDDFYFDHVSSYNLEEFDMSTDSFNLFDQFE